MTVSKNDLRQYLTGQQAMNRHRMSELSATLPTIMAEESLHRFFELQQVAELATASPAARMPHDISHLLKIRRTMQRQQRQ